MLLINSIFALNLLFLFPSTCNFVSSSNDDIITIRQRVLELTIWPKQENIPGIVRNALAYSRTLNNSCCWPDINYNDRSIVVWLTAIHMDRITTMLQALTVNGSTVKNDTKLMANVHCALNVWFRHDWQNPNWWFNQIHIPLQATSQLLMLGDNATDFEIEKIKEISFRASWWLHRSQDVGANLVCMIQCQLYRSLSTMNVTGIEQGFARMWQDIAVSPIGEQGVQTDWSYHFHGLQLLSGAYGLVWANNILLFLQCSQNTRYQLDNQTLSIFVQFLIKGDAWMIPTNEWDWHVVGRGISGPGNGFAHGLQTNWMRSISQLVQSNETRIQLIDFANRLDNQPNISLLIGNKHFFVSDYQVHRRTNWISTIKMQSIRTQPIECINGQNLKDEHGGQGVLNLYRIGYNDYLQIFPIIDWQAINGITVEHDISLEPCIGGTFALKKLSFVGGVSDGQYGLAMMDTASHNLTARRSWHFYDDAIIALATNLTLTTSTTAWTTLISRLLSNGQVTIGFFNSTVILLTDGNYSFPYIQNSTSNIQWIHVSESNIGYLLQIQEQYASLGVEVGVKTGNYDAIGPFNSTVTARMLTLWIDHGIGPYTLNYAYMILPNVSLSSMLSLLEQYSKEQVFICISNNNLFHGTMWPALKRASFVLWDNITTIFSCQSPLFTINIELSNAGAYLFSETVNDFTLTASHPVRMNATMKVTVDRMGYGTGCEIASDIDKPSTDIVLRLPTSAQLLGASVNVTCQKQRVEQQQQSNSRFLQKCIQFFKYVLYSYPKSFTRSYFSDGKYFHSI